MKSSYESELEEILYQDFNFDFVCLRHELGLTQQEMADKSHVLRDKIAKIERGIYPPNIKSVLRILGPLGYTLKIEKIDKERARHYKYYTNQEWGNLNNYDIALNSDYLGVEKTAKIIEEMILSKTK